MDLVANFAFHLISLAAFAVLVWRLVILEQRLRLLRSIIASTHTDRKKSVRLDWPVSLTSRAAKAFDVALDLGIPPQVIAPQRIDVSTLALLFAQNSIERLRFLPTPVGGDSKKVGSLQITTSNIASVRQLLSSLEALYSNQIDIKISPSEERNVS